MADHAPDIQRIPVSLRSLDWQPVGKDRLYEDGDRFLAAVAVCDKHKATKWYYDLSVIAISCDSEYFTVTCNDEPWGWDLADVDFMAAIR